MYKDFIITDRDNESKNQEFYLGTIEKVHVTQLSRDVDPNFAESDTSATCTYDVKLNDINKTFKEIRYGGYSPTGWAKIEVLPVGTTVLVAVDRTIDESSSVRSAWIIGPYGGNPIRSTRLGGLPTVKQGDFLFSSGSSFIHIKSDGGVDINTSYPTQGGNRTAIRLKMGNQIQKNNASKNTEVLSISAGDVGKVIGIDNQGNISVNVPDLVEVVKRCIETIQMEKQTEIGTLVDKQDKLFQDNDMGIENTTIGREKNEQVGHVSKERVGYHRQKYPFKSNEMEHKIEEGKEVNVKGDYGVYIGQHYDKYGLPSGGNAKITVANESEIKQYGNANVQCGGIVTIEKHVATPGYLDADTELQGMLSVLIPGLSLAREPVTKANILTQILTLFMISFDSHTHVPKTAGFPPAPPYLWSPKVTPLLPMIKSNVLEVT